MAQQGTRYYVEWAGEERIVEIRQGRGGLEVLVDGDPHPADLTAVEDCAAGAHDGGLLNLLVDHQSWTYAARFENGAAVLSFHDREVRVPIEDERGRLARLATGGGAAGSAESNVASVMPGVVKEVLVAAGDTVEAGQPLLILEAMKMENEIRAPRQGVVEVFHVSEGQAVEKGAPLVSLAPA